MICLIILTVLYAFNIITIEPYADDPINQDNQVYSFDQLFRDVKTYQNDNSYHLSPTFKSGIYKCSKDCKGHCLERGQTGIAYCFPSE
jgi:hypothetical protein